MYTCKARFKPWIYKVGSIVFTNRASVELLIDKISRQKQKTTKTNPLSSKLDIRGSLKSRT